MSELSKEKLEALYELIEVARATGKIKKGTNEATKAIEKGTAKIVAYAEDLNPPEVAMHIPLLAKDKGIPCFSVPSKEELGSAAGLVVPTGAVAVVDLGNGKKVLQEVLKGEEVPEEKPAEDKKEEASEEKPAEDKKEEASEEKPAEEKKE